MMMVVIWGNLFKIFFEGKLREIILVVKRFLEIFIVVDKMYMKGYVDCWCKENCDVCNIEEFREVSIVDKVYFFKKCL